MEKVLRYLSDNNYYQIITSPEKLDECILSLTSEKVLYIVTMLNKLLRNKEKEKISIVLGDNESCYSIVGLTILLIAEEKGQLNEWIQRNDKQVEETIAAGFGEEWLKSRLSFNLIKNKDLLLQWKIDDWRKVIQIGNELKCMQFNNLNQIFVEKQSVLSQNM